MLVAGDGAGRPRSLPGRFRPSDREFGNTPCLFHVPTFLEEQPDLSVLLWMNPGASSHAALQAAPPAPRAWRGCQAGRHTRPEHALQAPRRGRTLHWRQARWRETLGYRLLV